MRHGGSYRFPQRMHRGVFTHPPSLFKNVADVGAGRGIVAYDLLVDVPFGDIEERFHLFTFARYSRTTPLHDLL